MPLLHKISLLNQEKLSHKELCWHILVKSVLVYFLSLLVLVYLPLTDKLTQLWIVNAFLLGIALNNGLSKLYIRSISLFVGNLAANLSVLYPLHISLAFALANTVELSLAAFLIYRYIPHIYYKKDPADIVKASIINLLFAVPCGATIATLSVSSLWAGTDFELFYKWWFSHVIGTLLVFLPVLLIAASIQKNTFSLKNIISMFMASMFFCCLIFFLIKKELFYFVFITAPLIIFALYNGGCKTAFVGLFNVIVIGSLLWLGLIPNDEIFTNQEANRLWLSTALTVFFPTFVGLITDQVRIQNQQLIASEARFKNAMEFAATGFVLVSAEAKLIEANSFFCRMVGYSRAELEVMDYSILTHPDDYQRSQERLQGLLDGQYNSYRLEKRYIHKYGHIVWADLKVSKLEGDSDGLIIVQIDDVSERKKQQEEILKLSDRLRLATDAVKMGIWDWHIMSDTLIWDERMYDLYHIERSQIPSYDFWRSLVHPDDIITVDADLHAALEKGDYFSASFRINVSGVVRYIRAEGIILRDGEQQALRVVGVNFDITLQKEAEYARDYVNKQRQMLIDAMPAMISYWDTQLVNHFANHQSWSFFARSAEQIHQQHLYDLLPNYAWFEPYIQRVLAKESVQVEYSPPHQADKTILLSYVPDIENNSVKGFYLFATDITHLKQAQQAKESAQALLVNVIDAASEFSIIATDIDGKITLFSKGSERMLGYRADEVVNQHTPALIHKAEEIASRAAILSVETGKQISGFAVFTHDTRGGGAHAREWSYVRKDGQTLPVYLVVTALRDSHNRVTGFVGVAKDISAEKRFSQELISAKEQAEQASRAKTEFVANMSHEIRTPMNAVLGMSYLLANTELSVDQKKYLEMIRVSSQSLLDILNDILDFSKIEAGKMSLHPVDFYLDDTLNALASIMTVNAGQKDLELAIGVDPDVPSMLIGDALRLQQILVNLTGNAIKFTERGEVVVAVSLVTRQYDRVRLRFSVKDTGIGMTPAQQENLFNAFSQVDGSITRRFGGTGLGLTISQRLVEMMDSDIQVKSQLGQGSEFSFTVDLQVSQREVPVQRKPSMGSLRLLIIDDNKTSLTFLSQMIARWGWQATLVDTAEQALQWIEREQQAGRYYDAILTDWQMPAMDGLALALTVKSSKQRAPIPVMIMVSAFARDTLMHQKQIDYIDGVLIKPITSSVLYDTLHETLNQRRGQIDLHRVVARTTANKQLDGLRLLLVEDNHLNQVVAKNILEQAGAKVDIAHDGQQAIHALQQYPHYHAVLMDVQMPVMDGFTATRTIRQQLRLSLPIIAMTAGVMDSERHQCETSGMNGFIAKPLDVNEMLSTILRLAHTSAWRETNTVTTTQGGKQTMTTEPNVTIPPIEQFDPQAFLTVVGGDHILQYELTEQFIENYQTVVDEVNACLAQHDIDGAARLLHTLKGLAGTFKANSLARSALALEHELLKHQGYANQDSELANFQYHVTQTLERMQQWLVTHPIPNNVVVASHDSLNVQQWQELLLLLEQHNMKAFDVFEQMRSTLVGLLPTELYTEIDTAMNKLQFNQVKSKLTTWHNTVTQH